MNHNSNTITGRSSIYHCMIHTPEKVRHGVAQYKEKFAEFNTTLPLAIFQNYDLYYDLTQHQFRHGPNLCQLLSAQEQVAKEKSYRQDQSQYRINELIQSLGLIEHHREVQDFLNTKLDKDLMISDKFLNKLAEGKMLSEETKIEKKWQYNSSSQQIQRLEANIKLAQRRLSQLPDSLETLHSTLALKNYDIDDLISQLNNMTIHNPNGNMPKYKDTVHKLLVGYKNNRRIDPCWMIQGALPKADFLNIEPSQTLYQFLAQLHESMRDVLENEGKKAAILKEIVGFEQQIMHLKPQPLAPASEAPQLPNATSNPSTPTPLPKLELPQNTQEVAPAPKVTWWKSLGNYVSWIANQFWSFLTRLFGWR